MNTPALAGLTAKHAKTAPSAIATVAGRGNCLDNAMVNPTLPVERNCIMSDSGKRRNRKCASRVRWFQGCGGFAVAKQPAQAHGQSRQRRRRGGTQQAWIVAGKAAIVLGQ